MNGKAELAGTDELDESRRIAVEVSRRTGKPVWIGLLETPTGHDARWLSELLERWAGSLVLSYAWERKAALDAMSAIGKATGEMEPADAELVRRALLRAGLKYANYVHRSSAWRVARMRPAPRPRESRPRRQRVRSSSAASRDGPGEPDEPPGVELEPGLVGRLGVFRCALRLVESEPKSEPKEAAA